MSNSEEETIKKLSKYSLKPYKSSIGKQIGSNIWFHSSYSELFHSYLINANKMIDKLPFEHNILRIDTKKNNILFINSPDFDSSHEPIIKETALFVDGELSKTSKSSSNPLIYHHKWMFVLPDYKGFDYYQEAERSLLWKEKLGINRKVSSRIGRKNYWVNWLKSNGLDE